jgi:hypothetical protein
MRLWKWWYARIEPRVNHVLLVSILVCLVVLLTYLLGGAGAFTVFRHLQADSAAAPMAPSATAKPSNASGGSASSPLVNGALTISLQVSPLDIPYNCALGVSAAQAVTIANPDSVTHHIALSWNGPSDGAQGFSASLQQYVGGVANTVLAHDSRRITITGFTLLPLNLNPTSQYLWISDDTTSSAQVVAKAHVWCATPPLAVPTITLTPLLP